MVGEVDRLRTLLAEARGRLQGCGDIDGDCDCHRCDGDARLLGKIDFELAGKSN